MSKPKKPGTDLAALKARLAKKTKGADAAAPPPEAAPMNVPPPGQVAAPAPAPAPDIPPPGQVAAPAPAPAPMDVPPPGQQMAPPQPDIPAPGQQFPPQDVPPPGQPMAQVPPPGQPMAPPPQAEMPQAAPPQMAPTQTGDDPFGGASAMGGFDPDAGLIDGGEIKPRGNKGIVVFAALLAAGIGAIGGWLGHKIISTQEKIDKGQAKGEKMVAQVSKISDARKSVSLAMEDLKKEVVQDPGAAAGSVTKLLTETFDKQPQISELFGWQVASIDPQGLKATFQLYEQTTELQQNLSVLANFLKNYGPIMKIGGPTLFGLTFGPSGAQLVAVNKGLCGALPEGGVTPEAMAALKPCPPADMGKAVAYQINDMSGEPKVLLRGVGENQAVLLLAEGKIYEYAIGIEPGKNAANFYTLLIGRLNESLEAMDQAEEKALTALKRYAEDPNVDGPAASAEGE